MPANRVVIDAPGRTIRGPWEEPVRSSLPAHVLQTDPRLELSEQALVVASTHRLARQQVVSVEDLADEEVARLPPSTPPAVYDLLIPPRTPSGRPIRRTQPAQTVNEVLSLVARGRIVHPTSSTVPIFNRDDVALIPIDGLPPIPLGLVWCATRDNPRIRALDEVARSMIAAL